MNEKIKIWFLAARPQTLAAAFIPVLVGASLAWRHDSLQPAATAVALFCALAIQIGTNFANDYFDFRKGSDTDRRIGFKRATASGLVRPPAMLRAAILVMAIAFLSGLYLVWIGGWVIFWIGVLSLVFGILYTGGPWPLGYNGLGDIFVFLFFGFAAVTGTFYVNTLQWTAEAFWVSVPAGALCVNILVVNNLRDIDQDRLAGKRTLGVLLGEQALKLEYLAMHILAYATLPFLYTGFHYSGAVFLPLLAFPLGLFILREVWFHHDKAVLNKTLEHTARFMTVFGILYSIGILMQKT
ncbi:MAG: 1,4-dihydroxy-2-naphthoate polyprenyltransferase [Balneolaceae bacterium]